MKVDLFDFDLPPENIADRPVSPRDSARLLDLTGAGFADRGVRDLPNLLRAGDLMVFNDTRVIPARLIGTKADTGGKIEVTLHRMDGPNTWAAFARPAKKLNPGVEVVFGEALKAEVLQRDEGEVLLHFNKAGANLIEAFETVGTMPLPPYMKRQADAKDRVDYQTVYAKREGAVAAPTAGLHFTPELLAALDARGVKRTTVTLHVGAGTFLPVKAEVTTEHEMHAEWGEVSAETAHLINETKAAGGRVVSVGTTSLRLLESAATEDGTMEPFSDETDIFITPGYRFKAVDLLMTNFHLPRSTLFMLVSAFSGLDRMQDAYAHAIKDGYRFYSYGDACLLERSSA